MKSHVQLITGTILDKLYRWHFSKLYNIHYHPLTILQAILTTLANEVLTWCRFFFEMCSYQNNLYNFWVFFPTDLVYRWGAILCWNISWGQPQSREVQSSGSTVQLTRILWNMELPSKFNHESFQSMYHMVTVGINSATSTTRTNISVDSRALKIIVNASTEWCLTAILFYSSTDWW